MQMETAFSSESHLVQGTALGAGFCWELELPWAHTISSIFRWFTRFLNGKFVLRPLTPSEGSRMGAVWSLHREQTSLSFLFPSGFSSSYGFL